VKQALPMMLPSFVCRQLSYQPTRKAPLIFCGFVIYGVRDKDKNFVIKLFGIIEFVMGKQ
jgi:hypothetical protein